jgi:hypothetical protein
VSGPCRHVGDVDEGDDFILVRGVAGHWRRLLLGIRSGQAVTDHARCQGRQRDRCAASGQVDCGQVGVRQCEHENRQDTLLDGTFDAQPLHEIRCEAAGLFRRDVVSTLDLQADVVDPPVGPALLTGQAEHDAGDESTHDVWRQVIEPAQE